MSEWELGDGTIIYDESMFWHTYYDTAGIYTIKYYITNIEGVLNRFQDIVEMILRQARRDNEENVEKCLLLLEEINEIKKGNKEVEIILLDPMGHSQILHDDAVSRELAEEEIAELSVGISIPVFDINSDNNLQE